MICTAAIKGLEKAKIDDVAGAIPAHLVCGIWGTLAASIAGVLMPEEFDDED